MTGLQAFIENTELQDSNHSTATSIEQNVRVGSPFCVKNELNVLLAFVIVVTIPNRKPVE
jgi:hypothetical protein